MRFVALVSLVLIGGFSTAMAADFSDLVCVQNITKIRCSHDGDSATSTCLASYRARTTGGQYVIRELEGQSNDSVWTDYQVFGFEFSHKRAAKKELKRQIDALNLIPKCDDSRANQDNLKQADTPNAATANSDGTSGPAAGAN